MLAHGPETAFLSARCAYSALWPPRPPSYGLGAGYRHALALVLTKAESWL
jgi:hypothetical protein